MRQEPSPISQSGLTVLKDFRLPDRRAYSSSAITHPGFLCHREVYIPELEATVFELEHRATGAAIFIFKAQTPVQTFGIAFGTQALDNRGLPHCAEHWVLRGSQLFPSSDSFIQYLKASLSVANNAETTFDHTLFYAAGCNSVDFTNQLRLVLDAAFMPLLRDDSFREEVWRLEHLGSEKRARLNGIVLNEMKGMYADPLAAHDRFLVEQLLPDTSYRFDFGGHPLCIPDITPDELADFVRANYHPSNSNIFLFSNADYHEHLSLAAEYLDRFEKQQPIRLCPVQRPFMEPRRRVCYYLGGEAENAWHDTIVSINWVVGYPGSESEKIAFEVLGQLLQGESNAPLRQALLSAGLAEELNYDPVWTQLPFAIFSVRLTGAAASKADLIERATMETLTDLAQTGFASHLILRAMDTIELHYRQEANNPCYGQIVMEKLFRQAQRQCDPLTGLTPLRDLAELRRRWSEDPTLFQRLISETLLDNTHRLTLVVRPHRSLLRGWQRQEIGMVHKLSAQLGASSQCKVSQEMGCNDRDLLQPLQRLELKDLRREQPQPKPSVGAEQHLFLYPFPTHGLVYGDITYDLRRAPLELLPYAGLLTKLLLHLEDPADESSSIGAARTWASLKCAPVFQKKATFARMILSFECKSDYAEQRMDLLRTAPGAIKSDDRDLILQITRESKAELKRLLLEDGMNYSADRAAAGLGLSEWIDDQWQGIGQLRFLSRLERAIKGSRRQWQQVVENIEALRQIILLQGDCQIALTAEELALHRLEPHCEAALRDSPSSIATTDCLPPWEPPFIACNEGFSISSDVNYIGRAFDLGACGYSYHGSMQALLKLIQYDYLWNRVRRDGGAYLPGVWHYQASGIFLLGSYRDLNLLRTLKIFEGLPRWLRSQVITDDELRRGIIGAIGDLDMPMGPYERSSAHFYDILCGLPADFRRQERNQIFETNAGHCIALADLLERAQGQRSPITVLGHREALEDANRQNAAVDLRIMPLD